MRRVRRPRIQVTRRRATAVVSILGAAALASLLFAPDARATVSFGPLAEYSAGDTLAHASGTNGVALGDFDADGDPDIVAANVIGETVNVLLNNGNGVLGAPTQIASGGRAAEVVVASFNGDTDPDIAVVNQDDDNMTIFLGTGASAATFSTTTIGVGDAPVALAGANVDGDGDIDLIVVNEGSDNVSILLGDGAGGFSNAPGSPIAVEDGPEFVAVGNLNADADPDIAISNVGSLASTLDDSVSLLLGGAGAAFSAAAGSPIDFTGYSLRGLVLTDFDGDGDADLAVTDTSTEDVDVLVNAGGAVFGPPTVYDVGNNPYAVTTANVDLDADPDLLVATQSSGVSVLEGATGATFDPAVTFNPGGGTDITTGNLNAGTDPDIVTARDGKVGVLLNTPNHPPTATVDLSSATPRTNDTLTATATRADADGTTPSLHYVWKVAGVTKRDIVKNLGTPADLTDMFDLSIAGNGNKGQVVTVDVTPSDGTTQGTTVSDSATIQNSPPTATVSLNTSTPKPTDTLTATAPTSDEDGDAVSRTYEWRVNGGLVPSATTSTLDLTGLVDVGDAVTVKVTPNDGTVNGTPVSASATVTNSAPSATVSLSPSNPTTNATLTATATRSDTDGDTVSLTYVWKVAGAVMRTTPKSAGTAADLSDTFDLSVTGNGDKGQVITVEVTPNDGTTNGTTASDQETVQNSAPSAVGDSYLADLDSSLTVSAPGVLDNDPADADGDAITASKVANPGHGSVTVAADGSFVYLPNAGYSGPDSFTYRTSDGSAFSSPVTVSITVRLTCGGLTPTIVGTSGADKIKGTAGRDVIVGLGGNDTILAAGGDDVICGGAGVDTINADAGNDIVFGGSGNDIIHGDAGNDMLFGDDGVDSLQADAGNDTMDGGAGSPDVCQGGDGIDVATATCEKKSGVP